MIQQIVQEQKGLTPTEPTTNMLDTNVPEGDFKQNLQIAIENKKEELKKTRFYSMEQNVSQVDV